MKGNVSTQGGVVWGVIASGWMPCPDWNTPLFKLDLLPEANTASCHSVEYAVARKVTLLTAGSV